MRLTILLMLVKFSVGVISALPLSSSNYWLVLHCIAACYDNVFTTSVPLPYGTPNNPPDGRN